MKITKPNLEQKMRQLGFNISHQSIQNIASISFDIERDLIEVIIEARKDYRILGLLQIWFKKHADVLIIEKFFKFISQHDEIDRDDKILNFLIAFAIINKHNKWKRLLNTNSKKAIYPIDPESLAATIKINGKDEAFFQLGILVPNGFLKTDEAKIDDQKVLAKSNKQYRNRLIIGPNWRADIITAIELELKNPFQISTTIGCGYESAYRVMKEYKIAHSL
jgi:hypothetical protein